MRDLYIIFIYIHIHTYTDIQISKFICRSTRLYTEQFGFVQATKQLPSNHISQNHVTAKQNQKSFKY